MVSQSSTLAPFDKAMEFVKRWEGGYVDHPADPGGATNYGISLRFVLRGSIWLDLDRDGDTDADDIKILDYETAKKLYREHFWLPIKGDALPFPLSIAVFDTAVNMGVSVAAKMLQRATGQNPDGVIGPRTIAASYGGRKLIVEFLVKRMKRYTELATFPTFGTGWVRRTMYCQDYCTALAGMER